MNRRSGYGSLPVKLLLAAFFIVTVILPLISMFSSIAGTDVKAIFTSARFTTALKNSLLSAGLATLLSVLLATALAWCIVRTNIKWKGMWTLLFTLPMLIPSISHGMGLIVLLGSNGVLTNLLGIQGSIYGLSGILVGSVMYSFPVAFLMIVDILRYEDSTPYEAASLLGIPKWRQFTAITLPYLRRPMISAIFATFTLIVTDYGVPITIGGKFATLPVLMYQDVIGLLDFGKGSVIGLVLLAPALIAFVVDLMNKNRGNMSYAIRPFAPNRSKGSSAVAYALCIAASLLVFLPIAAFAILTFVVKYPLNMTFTFNNMLRTLDMGGGQYLLNSVVIGLFVAVIGVVISFATAYLTARMPSKSSRFLHLISITSLAIPGLAMGISYVLFFKGSFLYGTLAILILVNLMHFFASPYLMMYNTLGKLNGNLEAVGATLGIGRMRIIKDVLIPQSRGTLAEMFSYFFVNSMMTISAVSFLSNINTQPISLMINAFEAQMLLECAAFVSLLILAVNLVMKGLIYLYKRKTQKGMEAK